MFEEDTRVEHLNMRVEHLQRIQRQLLSEIEATKMQNALLTKELYTAMHRIKKLTDQPGSRREVPFKDFVRPMGVKT